jgi:hypothetical protein
MPRRVSLRGVGVVLRALACPRRPKAYPLLKPPPGKADSRPAKAVTTEVRAIRRAAQYRTGMGETAQVAQGPQPIGGGESENDPRQRPTAKGVGTTPSVAALTGRSPGTVVASMRHDATTRPPANPPAPGGPLELGGG